MQNKVIVQFINIHIRKEVWEMLKILERVHTQGNLINDKIASIKMLLFEIYKTDQLI